MKNFLTPPAFRDQLPKDQIDSTYAQKRLKVFIGIFIGYAAYYLVRKNLSLAMPYLLEMGFDKSELGLAFSFNATAYGLSKFIMGGISDRSDARKFLSLGLILASTAIIIAGSKFGFYNVALISVFQFLIGWLGGMGWPPCGRVMTHWFSSDERGTKMAIWNVAHNVGGGLIGLLSVWGTSFALSIGFTKMMSWQFGIFWLPATIAILVAIISYLLIRDTPQSCGLPSIEEHRNCYPAGYSAKHEEVLSTKDIFLKYVLNNRVLWYVALANTFVYFVRYGVLDWAPTYLTEVKHYEQSEIGIAYSLYEWAAIPGTLLCGYLSDKIFKGNRSLPNIICMALVMFAIAVYWLNGSNPIIDIIALVTIGFFIYGPVMLIGVQALDLSPKNAAGTSAGLTGFFGYFFGTSLLANVGYGYIVEHWGWNPGFMMLLASCAITIILMFFILHKERIAAKSK